MRRGLVWLVLFIGLALRVWISLTKPEVLWIDDSFYSLGIARNIAAGVGWTHDGAHVTNGFQPLYVFLMVPVYWLLPTQGYLVAVLALLTQSILNVLTGLALYRLMDHLVGWHGAFLALVCWNLSPYIISGVNGLETPLQAFGVVLISYKYVLSWRHTLLSGEVLPRQRYKTAGMLGLALGLLALTRIDSLIYAAAILGDVAVRFTTVIRHDSCRWRCAVWTLGLVCIALVVTMVPWFLASYTQTGQLVFDSGGANRLRAVAEYDGENLLVDHAQALIPNMQLRVVTPVLPWAAPMRRRYLLLTVLGILASGVLACSVAHGWQAARTKAAKSAFLYLFGGGVLSAYVLYQYTIWNWPRYFYALSPVGLVPLAAWVHVIVRATRGVHIIKKLSVGSLVYALILLAYTALLPGSLPASSNPLRAPAPDWFTSSQYRAAAWLRTNTPPDTRVAAFQSGIIGYFSDREVTNLDGVVNSDALPYFLSGSIAQYLSETHVEYVVDWRSFTETVDFAGAGLSADVVATFTDGNPVDIIRISGPKY